ncbi:MAG: hypothetical protein HOQ26_16840, partial [Gemmatimonadaceae bacterium]|nr:hypothetical protein [Gemmatimonadaceae bacterium]
MTPFTLGLSGWRVTVTIPGSNSTRRQPPQSAATRESSAWIHRRAAPAPRVAESVSLIVWRVPKETSVESVRRMRAGSTSARAAASAASRGRP